MSNGYYVLPAGTVDPPNFTAEVSFPGGIGWLLMIAALLVSLEIEAAIGKGPVALAVFIVLEVVAILLAFAIRGAKRKAQVDARVGDWMRQEIARCGNDARNLTQRASEIMERFYGDVRSLPAVQKEADLFLRNAEEEFTDKAYSPFWDNIEQAAMRLGVFNATLTRLEVEVNSYNRLLAGQVHNFPPLTIRSDDIPNPAPQAERLRQLVRKGQKDFEFATIWEHRKTQNVILEGFRTLGEAINNLGSLVTDSFSRAISTIEETSEKQREEQVRLRDSFDKAVSKWEEQKKLYGS